VEQTSETTGTRFDLPGCVVRSFDPRDAESLAAHANCRDVWLNLRDGFPHPYTRADAEEFIHKFRHREPETVFAIAVDGQAVGGIGFRLGEDVERTGAEIGYWLGKAFWGRGIMTQALVAVRDHAIRNHSLTRVFALPFEWNPASFRVLEKSGFVLEGRLRRAVVKDGRVIDQLMYAYVTPGVP